MPDFLPLFSNPVDLTLSIGTSSDVKGYVLKIDDVGEYLIPQHILDEAKSNDHYENYDEAMRQRYFLNLMLMFVENSSSQ